MAPPTSKPRLAQIDPDALAKAVEDDAIHHAHRLALTLSPRVELRVLDSGVSGYTQIGLSVRDLAAYAVGGARLDAPVHDYMISLLEVLGQPVGGLTSTTVIDEALDGRVDVDDLDTDTIGQLALVTCAALARERVENGRDGQSVPASWLAALAGTSTRQVQHISLSGDGLKRDADGDVTAASARAWLAARRLRASQGRP